jgi:hypothetical protein
MRGSIIASIDGRLVVLWDIGCLTDAKLAAGCCELQVYNCCLLLLLLMTMMLIVTGC